MKDEMISFVDDDPLMGVMLIFGGEGVAVMVLSC
jgi:hypothetical protein